MDRATEFCGILRYGAGCDGEDCATRKSEVSDQHETFLQFTISISDNFHVFSKNGLVGAYARNMTSNPPPTFVGGHGQAIALAAVE
jgi:hypothetical protein